MAVPTIFADNKPPFDSGNMRGKLTAFDLLNQQRTAQVGRGLQSGIGQYNDSFLQPTVFQPPRYAQLSFSADFR
jgi:hypothetical protein